MLYFYELFSKDSLKLLWNNEILFSKISSVTCDLPKTFLPKNLSNCSICQRQFAESQFAKIFDIFILSAVKLKMLNDDLPNYNLPKRHFNNTNVDF